MFRTKLIHADREKIQTLLEQTLFFNAEEVQCAMELVDDALSKGQKSEYRFLLAQDNAGTLLGYICYGRILGTQSSYDLYWIAVDKTKQNQKAGKRLLAEMDKHILHESGSQISRVYAETSGRALYQPTHQFYLRNEFILEGRLKDFYSPGDDKLIFTKVLDSK